jgi:hypothetical protein
MAREDHRRREGRAPAKEARTPEDKDMKKPDDATSTCRIDELDAPFLQPLRTRAAGVSTT